MKVTLTGGNGFIGAFVIRRLIEKNVSVRVMDLVQCNDIVRSIVGDAVDSLEWRIGDISKKEDVAAAVDGSDAVIHLAGALGPVCERDPALGATVNLVGTLHLFTLAKERRFGIVYASTAGIFGPFSGDVPAPTTHYGAFKFASELSARVFYQDNRISSVGLRPLTVYGPGRLAGNSAGPTLACRAAARGERYTIPFTGPTDFIYVDDVAAAFVAAAFNIPEGAHAFNIHGVVADTRDLIDTIHKIKPGASITAAGAPVPIAALRSNNGLETFYPSLPKTSLADGVAATIRYYEAIKDRPEHGANYGVPSAMPAR